MINYIMSESCKLLKEKYKTRHDGVGTVMHRELCKKLKIKHMKQELYAHLRIPPEEWDAQTSLGFWETTRSSYLGQVTIPSNRQQKTPAK